jgi:hypothetical protein
MEPLLDLARKPRHRANSPRLLARRAPEAPAYRSFSGLPHSGRNTTFVLGRSEQRLDVSVKGLAYTGQACQLSAF